MKDKEILEEMKKDIKEILEILKNPKKEIPNEKPYYPSSYPKKEIIISNPTAPATQPQKDFLIEKKYNGDVDSLNKLEASKLIEAYLRGNGKRN
jgi:hypothetical protein